MTPATARSSAVARRFLAGWRRAGRLLAAVLLAASALTTANQAMACPPTPDFEQVLSRLNALRATGADCGSAGRFNRSGPLVLNDQLQTAAIQHAADLRTRGELVHISSHGLSLPERVNAAGYRWRAVVENLAAGHRDTDELLQAWMLSSKHCANLMQPRVAEVGLGCVAHDGPGHATWWTLILAQPR
jgi:uncharacterized protein YkwD